MTETIDNPILNSPYEQPDRYYDIGPQGPTGQIRDGRRPSESFIPIAITRKGKRAKDGLEQVELDFDATGERRERNMLINDIRRDVAKWRRGAEYAGVTPITRKLLQHWADPDRDNRVLFCQREAAETAIFLTEVAGRTHGYADWRMQGRDRIGHRKGWRTPVDDNVAHPLVIHLRLWDFVGDKLPKPCAKRRLENWSPKPEPVDKLRQMSRTARSSSTLMATVRRPLYGNRQRTPCASNRRAVSPEPAPRPPGTGSARNDVVLLRL